MSTTYAEKLKDPRWQCVRERIIERDKGECKDCGSQEFLQVHHCIYADSDPWGTPDEFLITVCDSCHENRHALMKEVGDAIGKLSARMNIWHWWAATRHMRNEMESRADNLDRLLTEKAGVLDHHV